MNHTALAASSSALHTRPTAPLGDLMVAVFDEASNYSKNPAEVSRMAIEVLARILLRNTAARRAR